MGNWGSKSAVGQVRPRPVFSLWCQCMLMCRWKLCIILIFYTHVQILNFVIWCFQQLRLKKWSKSSAKWRMRMNHLIEISLIWWLFFEVLVLGDIVHSKTSPILRYFTATSIIRVYGIPTGGMENCWRWYKNRSVQSEEAFDGLPMV